MEIYIKRANGSVLTEEMKGTIKQQILDTMRVWREELKFDRTHFILDGGVSMDDFALFPIFYQEDKRSVCVVDKLKENTFYLNKSRYTLMYVWELDDIASPVDSDNTAYQVFTLAKYYEDIENVHTDGYVYLGKYDVIDNDFLLNLDINEHQ